MAGDRRFEESYNEDIKGGIATMTEALDGIENRGMEKGRLEILAGLVRDEILTVDQAAERSSFPVKELIDQCRKYHFAL